MGKLNPFRYRGYVYDEESGLYYLRNRYYNPELQRFITTDNIAYLGADNSVIGYNLYTYCLNSPANRSDESGNLSLPNWAKVAIGAVATVAAVAVTVATGGAAAPILIGVASSTVISGCVGYATNGVQGMIDSACNGFMWAGVGAFAGSAVSAISKAIQAAKIDPVRQALNQLNSSGVRPGQTVISRSRVMQLVDHYNPLKAQSSVYSDGVNRFLVEGHHTTVAQTILNKASGANMMMPTAQLPSATNVYWSKNWYEFWKTAIKIIK